MPARTSLTDPLRIDEVPALPAPGVIGITFCPGKRDAHAMSGAWERDLAMDLDAIRHWGANTLVTLIEDHEFGLLGVEALPSEAKAAGLEWIHLPIRDVSVPDGRFVEGWKVAGPRLSSLLGDGGRLVVHCRGGLGRAGMVASLLLIEQGIAPADAIRRVRAARPGAIETREQEHWVGAYVSPQAQGRR